MIAEPEKYIPHKRDVRYQSPFNLKEGQWYDEKWPLVQVSFSFQWNFMFTSSWQWERTFIKLEKWFELTKQYDKKNQILNFDYGIEIRKESSKRKNNIGHSEHWKYETSCQSRFDARYWMLGAGALERPRGMEWGGRREEGSGWGTHVYLWQIHFDIWQN